MMQQKLVVGVTWLVAVLVSGFAFVDEDPHVGPGSQPDNPGVVISDSDTQPGLGDLMSEPTGAGTHPKYESAWLLSCFDNHPTQPMMNCAAADSCDDPNDLRWTYWLRQVTNSEGVHTPTAPWTSQYTECRGDRPATLAPVVTDAVVLEAVRRLGLPRLTVRVQPAQETLVNLETIFYTDPPEWARTVQLLGYSVDVEATVDSYTWTFGDGATMSTSGPGAPYPSNDIVHAYTDAHVTVSPRVDVEYAIRYRVNDGVWQTVDDTVPASGYPVPLEIREATALLVGD